MTPAEAARVLKVVDEDDVEVSASERRFCEEYFSGEFASNGTRSYLAANPGVSYDRASVAACDLLKQHNVQRFLEKLREQAIGRVQEKMVPWVGLLGRAQQIILATAEGRLKSRLQYEAAVYLINRVLGSPVATAEISLLDQNRVTGAIKNLTRRMSEVKVA